MEVDENDTFKSKIFKPNYPKILTNVLEFFFQSHAIVRTALLTDESEPAPQEQHTVTPQMTFTEATQSCDSRQIQTTMP